MKKEQIVEKILAIDKKASKQVLEKMSKMDLLCIYEHLQTKDHKMFRFGTPRSRTITGGVSIFLGLASTAALVYMNAPILLVAFFLLLVGLIAYASF